MDTPSGVAFICEADGKILPDFVDEEHNNPECPLENMDVLVSRQKVRNK